jgi:hypothetical protein
MISGPNPDYRPAAYDDDLEDIPTMGFWPKWFGGIALPLLLVGYGVACFVTRKAVLPGNHMSMDLYGAKAVAFGIASMSAGLFLHSHYFWGNIYHLSFWATLGKIVSACSFIAGLGYLIVRVGVMGK